MPSARTLPRLVLCTLAAAAVAACSDDVPTSLTITATPKKVAVGATNFTTLSIAAKYAGKPAFADQEILVETDLDSGCTFLVGSEQQSITLTTSANGTASTKLFSPTKPGTCHVIAHYTDQDGLMVDATVDVQYTTPTVTKLLFDCVAKNIGAYFTGENGTNLCRAYGEDSEGKTVRAATIKFLTEAGAFTFGDPDEEGRRPAFYDPKEGGREPKDVPPLGTDADGEPRWTHASMNNRVRNPRDGLATLVAYVEGDNQGLPCGPDTAATGCSEPFVDANDNNKYDPGEDYQDIDGDQAFSPEQDKVIWKQIKVLWTGPMYGTPVLKVTITDSAVQGQDYARGETKSYSVVIADWNFNTLASNSVEDDLTIEFPTGPGEASQYALPRPYERNRWGMDIDSNYRLKNASKRESYLIDAVYTFRGTNTRAPDDTDPPQSYSLTVTPVQSVGVDEAGAACCEYELGVSIGSGMMN